MRAYFDASLSSSTYQDGAKVNPENVKYPYYMVISTTGQTSEVEVDINKVSEDLAQKMSQADVDSRISEIMSTSKDTIVSWSIPDYSAGIEISASTNISYTAPSTGVLMMKTVGGTVGYVKTITINGYSVPNTTNTGSGEYNAHYTIPLCKGDEFIMVSTNTSQVTKFYPMREVS
jgi:hypothetical protein